MAISKIILNGVTQMDLTGDTVQASNLIAPNTAHGADGEAVVGTASGGVDVPTFTIVRNPNTGDATSITCDKTFAQCLDYGENGYGWTLLHEVVGEEEYYGTTTWYYQDSSHIIFSAMDGLYPSYDIQFNSNGTITLTEPSAQNTTMNITENGDYYPAGYTSLVHVAVASGATYTATITGTGANSRINYNGTNYYSGDTFTFNSGDSCTIYVLGDMGCKLYVDGAQVKSGLTPLSYNYTLPSYDITATLNNGNGYITFDTIQITSNGKYDVEDYVRAEVNVSGGSPSLQAKTNIDPTTSSQTITADSGYDGLSSVQINAMPTGTAGAPTATKGTVSNHQVSVTPSVTNTTGYISGGTKTGTAVTVTAAELASGNKAITSNGTSIDVVGYSTVSVDVPDSTLVVTVSYNSSTNRFEPDKTYSEISEANAAGKTIVVNCAMVPSIASADGVFDTNKFTYWVREYLDGSEQMLEQEYILNSSGLTKNQEIIYYENAPSSSKNIQVYSGYDEVNTTSYSATEVSITVTKTGTYKCSWTGHRNTTSGTSGSRLYKNGVAVGTAHTSGFVRSYGQYCEETLSLSEGDILTVYGRARATNYYMVVGNLIIEET